MQTPEDVADVKSWDEYEKFLSKLSRPERRRILRAHFNRTIQGRVQKSSSELESSNKRSR